MFVIETARLTFEPLSKMHAPLLYGMLQDDRLYKFIPVNPPESVYELSLRYAKLSLGRSPDGCEEWLNWALKERNSSRYIGLTQATVHLPSNKANIAYMIFSRYWKMGFGKEACMALIKFLNEKYKINSICALIDTKNESSIKLIESLEFEKVALIKNADKFKNKISDEYKYELILN